MGTVFDALNKGQRELNRVIPAAGEGVAQPRHEAAPEAGRWTEFIGEVDPHLIVHPGADPAAVEQFKSLRTSLFLQREKPPRTLLVASAGAGEGKSLVAANLAASVALGLTNHVILVDCDLRCSSVARLFGMAEGRGLADYLQRGEPLGALVVRTQLERLLLLPSGAAKHRNAPELLGSERMAELFSELAEQFPEHTIICDCPPMSAGPDAAIVSRHVDAALLVVMAGEVGREVVARSLKLLAKDKVIGMVFNCSRPSADGALCAGGAA